MKLLHATTVPSTLGFLRSQPAHLAAHGFDVVVLSSPGEELDRFAAEEGATPLCVPMHRGFSAGADIITLWRLIRVLRDERPDIVHAHTPKAGLLVTLAGRIAGVPLCIYQIHGLKFITSHGIRRQILKIAERCSTAAAHRVLCVSPSVLDLAEKEHVIARGAGVVLGSGTINGVDVERFDPDAVRPGARAVRAELGIAPEAPVIGFVGRLAADKGVGDLERAWSRVRVTCPDAHLVLVGVAEENDPVDADTMSRLEQDPRVHLAGFRKDVRPFYSAFTMLVLPSAREGFPQTVLEASAMALPVLGSDVPGVRDAVQDGVTGLLFPFHDASALASAVIDLLADPVRATSMGAAGRLRALEHFDRRNVRELFLDFYREASAERGIVDRGRVRPSDSRVENAQHPSRPTSSRTS